MTDNNENYNYEDFSTNQYNLDRFLGPKIGNKAPDFSLSTLMGTQERLLDFEGEFLVLELGSITCPLFQGRREGMSDLVAQYSNVSFSVLYVREAHPGNKIPSHKSQADKSNRAKQLCHDQGEQRKILIDDLAGTAHDAYGSYPNAIFIINKNGCVVFFADWNSVPAVKKALHNLLDGRPAAAKSYFLPVKPTIALRTLRESGDGAVGDFLIGLPKLIWKNVIRRNFLLLINSQKAITPDIRC